MNAKFLEHVKAGAVQVVAQKIADGAIDPATASFEDLVKEFEEKVLALADAFGAKNELIPTKIKGSRKSRKGGVGAPSGKGSVAPDSLEGYLHDSPKRTLQEIASAFGVSKGVAQRAVDALGDKVKSEPGTKPEGQRGKAPTVYFLAE